jgi:NADH-quinone oxidoreductase subunit L
MPRVVAGRMPALYNLLVNKYFVDEAYDAAVVTPTVRGSEKLLWKGIDVGVIDAIVNGLPRSVAALSAVLRKVQTGVAQNYMVVFVIGVVAILAWLLVG